MTKRTPIENRLRRLQIERYLLREDIDIVGVVSCLLDRQDKVNHLKIAGGISEDVTNIMKLLNISDTTYQTTLKKTKLNSRELLAL